MTPDFDPNNVAIAIANGGLIDLQVGELVIDGEGEQAEFCGYGQRAPIYVDLRYRHVSGYTRLPNSELRRAAA